MVYSDPFQVQHNYHHCEDCFLFKPINPAPISQHSQPNNIYNIEKKSSLMNNDKAEETEEEETETEEEEETETEEEEETESKDKSIDRSNLTPHDIHLEKRRLDYQDNKAHIKKLRQNSRFDCPCGSEVMSSKRTQHIRSMRHQLFTLKNPTIAIPTKPTNK